MRARSAVVLRSPAVASLLALALLAGCAQPAAQPAEASAPVAAIPRRALDWSQADCESISWAVPVMASALQPYLPAGFEPSPPEASPTSPGVEGAATLGFRAVECSYGYGEENILRSVQSGLLYTPVLPPAELREDRFAGRYTFGWDTLVASDAWRAQAMAWGVALRDGGALVGPTAQGWTGAVALDQVGTFEVTGRSVDRAQPVDGFEARTITVGSQGFALWDSESVNRSVATGLGTWTVSPESWVATVLGTTEGVATFEHAQYDLPSATLHWPGQALDPTEADEGGRYVGPLPLPFDDHRSGRARVVDE